MAQTETPISRNLLGEKTDSMILAEKEDLQEVLQDELQDKIGEIVLSKNVDLGMDGEGLGEGEDFDR